MDIFLNLYGVNNILPLNKFVSNFRLNSVDIYPIAVLRFDRPKNISSNQ